MMEPKPEESFGRGCRENVKSAPSGREFGLLEVLAYLVAIVVVVGSVVSGWDFNLLIALIMLVVLYAVLRDIRALADLTSRNDQTRSSDTAVSSQRIGRGARPQPATRLIPLQRREMHPFEKATGQAWSPSSPIQKGTRHESNEFRNA